MATGPMQFGTLNDSGSDYTELTSHSAYTVLRVFNTTAGEAIVAEGKFSGVTGYSDAAGGKGLFGASRGPDGIGVYGEASGDNGIGVQGNGFMGVRGESQIDATAATGIYGLGGGKNSNGVIGRANNGSQAYGVWGQSNTGHAGYFSGNVNVTGTITKGTSLFRIDHPLDPENRYLLHAAVESPEQLNIYSGTVVTDTEGTAVVELPEYFEALNTDFRYQLTVIGDFARAVVSGEVRDNRFSIATDRPEVKVSWQVSGVRQDRYARANPVVVEEEKSEEERGTYLYPEAWGKPLSAGVDHARITALLEQSKPHTDDLPPDAANKTGG
jgi:hypothetical protein